AEAAVRRVVVAALIAAGCGRDAPMTAETVARDGFVHALAVREGIGAYWYLLSRGDVVFEDGFTEMALVDPAPTPRWNEVAMHGDAADGDAADGDLAKPITAKAIAVRWIGPGAHLRVRERSGDMRLRIWGRIDRNRLLTQPRLTATLDGRELYSQVIGGDGAFVIEAAVPAAWQGGWSDVYVRLSSVNEPWRDPAKLRVARVEGVSWEPAR
ncbi:MAG: hypothetical protein K8W52_27820, partial [Deltaproteobacteria bacterium]|nr:hypothetical protein [Deltaproteobacteria bacterium]